MATDTPDTPGVDQFIIRLIDTQDGTVLVNDLVDNRNVEQTERQGVEHREIGDRALADGATLIVEIRHPDDDTLIETMPVEPDGSILRPPSLIDILIAGYDGSPLEVVVRDDENG